MGLTDILIELVVIRIRQENLDCKTIFFKRPINFIYKAGDWVDIEFAGMSLTGGNTYSLSSAPTERELAISFRGGISPFKQKLQTVEPGDKIFVSRFGNSYDFHLKDKKSSVLIAGGIGIAPFRSMLKELYDMGGMYNVQLIYLNKNDNFLFRNELEKWDLKLPNLTVAYVVTEELNRKSREKLILSIIKNTAHNYYIAGPEAMVENTEHLLLESGVNIKDIRIDSFGSY